MDTEVLNIITELDQYIALGKSRLGTILTALDWTVEDSLKESTCSASNGDKESCDPLLPYSFGCTNSVVIDKPQLQAILKKKNVSIPDKFSDIQLNFTREQKAKVYDYVIANTGKTSEPELKVSFPNDDNDNGMTFAEIVAKAKKKDKQLQRKYRTSKPTHIEEVRNLVHLQMQALDKYFNPESESQSSSYKDQKRNSGKSGCRDSFERVEHKSRRGNIDETIQNRSIESRNRTTSHHQNRKSDTTRSRSTDRSNRMMDRISPKVERRKHKSEKRSGNKDEASVDKTKKKQKKNNKSPKRKKKDKHHRKHSDNK